MGKKTSWAEEDGSGGIDSAKRHAASMQTPPPTSTSRRKVPEFNIEGTGEPLSKSSRRLSTNSTGPSQLDTPSRVAGVSPRLLWGLQGSPDLFQVLDNGPIASPFFPQHRLFWDQDADQHGNVNVSGPYADPFGSNTQPNPDDTFPSASPERQDQIALPMIPGSLATHNMGSDHGLVHHRSNVTMADHTFTAPFSTSPRVTRADDPTMFLSSPARRFGPPESRTEIVAPPNREFRQPYHYQIEESKREEELRRAKSQGRSHGSISWDEDEGYPPSIRGGRPSVRRSSTHSGSNPLNQIRQHRQ